MWAVGGGFNNSGNDPAVFGLFAFNATTLARVRTFDLEQALVPFPDLGIGTGDFSIIPSTYLATTNDGASVIVTSGPQVYVVNATTGRTTNYFTLPNQDVIQQFNLSAYVGFELDLEYEYGYEVAVAADNTLYFLDLNASPASTHGLYHTNSTGGLIAVNQLNLTAYGVVSSLAVDSAGLVYVGLDNVALVINGTTLLPIRTLTVPNVIPVGWNYFNLAISWGATPAQDALYAQIGQGATPVYVLATNGSVVTSFSPNHGQNQAFALVYDTYLNSYVTTLADEGGYAAVRLAHDLSTVLTRYPLPPLVASAVRNYANILLPAVDGTGRVAISFGAATPADPYYSYYVGVYNATGNLTAFFSAGAYSNPSGLAFINDTIYTSNPNNGSYLDMFSSAGVYRGNFTTPAFLSTTSLGHLQYVPSTTAGAAGALWVQLNNVNQIVAVDLATHATRLVYTVPATIDQNTFQLNYFGVSPSRTVLYVAGIANYSFPVAAAVDLSTGNVLATFNAGLKQSDTAVGTLFEPTLAVDALGNVVVPDQNAGFRQFAAVQAAATSVRGDPQFVGLRGQSFQVHGIDGAVYALISEPNMQLNARFTFLTGPRPCPIMPSTGQHSQACWSHDGSYLSELAMRVKQTGEMVRVVAGTASKGFERVEVNGKRLAVGDTTPTSSVQLTSTHELVLTAGSFSIDVECVDGFVNLRSVRPTVPFGRLRSHGLLGQTWSAQRHQSTLKVVEGEVDDYVLTEDDGLFGTDFMYSRYDGVVETAAEGTDQ